jgi:hypothetical protein
VPALTRESVKHVAWFGSGVPRHGREGVYTRQKLSHVSEVSHTWLWALSQIDDELLQQLAPSPTCTRMMSTAAPSQALADARVGHLQMLSSILKEALDDIDDGDLAGHIRK